MVLLRAQAHGEVEIRYVKGLCAISLACSITDGEDCSSDGRWDDDGWQFAKKMHEKLWPDEKVINPFEEDEDDNCEVCSFD